MHIDRNRPVAVVTGASSGIGESTARQLVELGWQVIGVGRDRQRSAAATARIAVAARNGGAFTMLRGDFTLMSEVERVAGEIASLTPRLDVLVNNAGGVSDQRIVTDEGTEATFAVNHLAPFLLTRRLIPLPGEDAAARPGRSVRVIAVSSNAHRMIQEFDWDDLQSLNEFDPIVAYGRAKLANILFTRELARRGTTAGIVAQAMHPGVVASNFASHGTDALQAHMATADTVSPDEPAETLVWLATAPAPGRDGGRYFHRKAEATPAAAAQDDSAATRLWNESERLLAELGFRIADTAESGQK
ncbi:SDR family NAD(P)-dependent oxidoreductase [Rhodococcus sp. ACS1]|uniref:SDR family NAD(P)-dependent oxidoreductase n=1 Tax=Rhodococcus sp. ACS1 TaxID=2028570 RepID=UPI0015C703A8|nr:SDR family NAD(P)-dependent oxidoreductase [Rhodococcus sp. ACS1]